MERYYEVDSDTSRRTRKNADLYQKIYETNEYSNIEGIATTLKPNEIDISKIKEMLKNREENKKETRIETQNQTNHQSNKVFSFEKEKDQNYDIRDILNKAKSERTEEDTYHKLKNMSFETLKNTSTKSEKKEEEEELKELINTITSTSMLNKLGDQELSLGLLDELKSDTMVGDASAIKAVLEEEKNELKDDNYLEDDKQNMDKSFFTSSLNFRDEDFDELQEMSQDLKKSRFILHVLAFILLVIVTASFIFFLLK